MGTLFKQEPRRFNHINYGVICGTIDEINKISIDMDITFQQVLDIMNMLEYKRRTDIMIDNGDAFDEQIAGLGELFKRFCSSFEDAFSDDISTFSRFCNILSEISEVLGVERD